MKTNHNKECAGQKRMCRFHRRGKMKTKNVLQRNKGDGDDGDNITTSSNDNNMMIIIIIKKFYPWQDHIIYDDILIMIIMKNFFQGVHCPLLFNLRGGTIRVRIIVCGFSFPSFPSFSLFGSDLSHPQTITRGGRLTAAGNPLWRTAPRSRGGSLFSRPGHNLICMSCKFNIQKV